MRQHILFHGSKFVHKQHIQHQLHGGSAPHRKNVGSMEYSGSGMRVLRRHNAHKAAEQRPPHSAGKIKPLKFHF